MNRRAIAIGALLIILVLISSACSISASKPTATPTSTIKLELVGVSGSKMLSVAEVRALPAVEGWGGIKSSTGRISAPVRFKGVALSELAKQLGGLTDQQGLRLVAKDGYAMTMSYDQAMNGSFITYDPGTGDEIKKPGKLTAILAYEADGKPLPQDSDGAFRLAVISEKNNQVVDGHWSVKWVTTVQIKSLAEEWTLALTGKITETMDRGTFESCSGSSCHGKKWTDDKAQVWQGTPLWLLAGRADDDNRHSDGAFNTAVADAGYTVKVIAKDGLTASFPISRVKGNNELLVAYLMNDNPLDEKYFPLRLVGPGLTGKESPGQVAQIVLEFNGAAAAPAATKPPATPSPLPPTPTTAAAKAPAGPAALTISGVVEKPLALSLDELKAVGVVKLELTHPKKGPQPYEGVRLKAVLDLARPAASAKAMTVTASDGYKTELSLADVVKCADCLVAIDSAGKLSLAMPGMESSAWAKDVVSIEVK